MDSLKKITIISAISVLISCQPPRKLTYETLSDSLAEFRTLREIKLDSISNPDSFYIQYENEKSIIFINRTDLLKFCEMKLKMDSLCADKKLYLNELKMDFQNLDAKKGLYYIQPKAKPSEQKEILRRKDYIQYKNNYIYPYGFKVETDTLKNIRFEKLKYFVITEMCLESKVLVLDKRIGKFTSKMLYQIIDFKDGHGGEMLLFKDKLPFLNVKVYSDIAWSETDCKDQNENQNTKKTCA